MKKLNLLRRALSVSRRHRGKRWLLPLVLLVPLAIYWLLFGLEGRSKFQYPEGEGEHGRLRYINGLPVLEVEGTPEEIGTAVASLALKSAEPLIRYPRALFLAATPEWLGKSFRDQLWHNTLRAGRQLLDNFPDRYKREYDALRKALPETWHESLLAGNTLFDVKRLVHCSAVIVRCERVHEPDHNLRGPILGRNLDFPTLGYLQDYSLVMVYRPRDRLAFVAVGFPGMVGVLSGMNEHGLCVAMLEVYESGDGAPAFNPQGIPYAICLRQILEECCSVKEARDLLSSMPRSCYYNVAVCDRQSGGVFEVTPKQVVFRTLENGVCACTNHFLADGLAVPTNGNYRESEPRLATLLELRQLKQVNLRAVQQALHRANQGSLTMQTMVFEPSALRLYLAVGQCPSSALPLVPLDATTLLTGKPRSVR